MPLQLLLLTAATLLLLSGRHNYVSSVIYYSIVSAQPFSGSEANMMSLFDKNQQAFEHFQSRQMHATDPDLR